MTAADNTSDGHYWIITIELFDSLAKLVIWIIDIDYSIYYSNE